MRPILRAVARWPSEGAMAPGGSCTGLAGALTDPARASASSARARAGIQPDERRSGEVIFGGSQLRYTLRVRLERAVRIKQVHRYRYHSMKPLAALLAILAGSAIALAVGLIMTWIVILFAPEQAALARAVVTFTLFAAVTSGSFYAQQRERGWRLAAHAATLAMFAVTVWLYWPK